MTDWPLFILEINGLEISRDDSFSVTAQNGLLIRYRARSSIDRV
jgi:hypothetical protein